MGEGRPVWQYVAELRCGQDLPWRCGRHQARSQVDRVAEVVTVKGQHRAIGKTGTDLQFGRARTRMIDEIHRRPHQSFGRRAHPHHGVADELHQPATVGMHHVGDGGVEFGEQVLQLRGVSAWVNAVKLDRSAKPIPHVTLADVSPMTPSK